MKSHLSAMRLLEFQSWAAALGIFAAVVLSVNDFALAGEAGVTRGHGYSFFGNLDYPVDYPHLSYVNPDASKGGELSQAGSGTFDSLIPYSRKGRTLAPTEWNATGSGFSRARLVARHKTVCKSHISDMVIGK